MDWSDLLVLIARRFDELQVPYFVTGSSATITFGEPRFTNDIDVVAAMQAEHIDGILNAFPAPEFYVSRVAVEEALRRHSMFNIIHPTSGLKIDVSIAEETEFDRSRLSRIITIYRPDGHNVAFSSPEDVIIKKMQFYREGGSEKHLRDITGVLKICQRPIDYGYIEFWSAKLNVLDIWKMILQRLADLPRASE